MRTISRQSVIKAVGIRTDLTQAITYPVTFTTGVDKAKSVLTGVAANKQHAMRITQITEF